MSSNSHDLTALTYREFTIVIKKILPSGLANRFQFLLYLNHAYQKLSVSESCYGFRVLAVNILSSQHIEITDKYTVVILLI